MNFLNTLNTVVVFILLGGENYKPPFVQAVRNESDSLRSLAAVTLVVSCCGWLRRVPGGSGVQGGGRGKIKPRWPHVLV